MKFLTLEPDESIALFVKSIMLFESDEKDLKTSLPFFADGYPGLIFHETENGLIVNPHKKLMPTCFIYGQTIVPVELVIRGSYKLVLFQLYPFVLKSFFDLESADLNDACYDIQEVEIYRDMDLTNKLLKQKSQNARVKLLIQFLHHIFLNKKDKLDMQIRKIIELIIRKKGKVSMQEVSEQASISERTLERRFFTETGLLPKQFAKIIQFQGSLEQLTAKDFSSMSDIVFANGFADQSHFIRVFKAFTGKTPKQFQPKRF